MAEIEPDNIAQEKQRIAGIFSRAAPTYDQVGPGVFSYYGQKLVDFAQIKPGSKVLDVASGRGALIFPAAQAVGKDGQVTGIDISESMVKETRKEIRHRKLNNVKIEAMDGEDLLFKDETFDVVLCGFAVFFFPQLERALAEIRRVLRPNGDLAVSTWEKYEDERWNWYDELAKSFLPPKEEKETDSSSHSPIPELDTPESMQAVLNAAGFIKVQSQTERFEVVYRSEEEWWTAQWSHGGRALLERIEATSGANGLKRFKVATFEGLSRMKQVDGIHSNWPALFTKALKPQD